MSDVYKSIVAVMSDLSQSGIAKDRKNTQGSGYNFRGIDDVYNVLSHSLAKNGLVIIPRVLSRENVERSSKNGGALFYTTVDVEFDIVSAADGSKHTARTVGEAMDSGDKSSNKAMSAAYKYMAFQTFCIPTEGDNDADAHTHEVKRGSADPLEGAIVPANQLKKRDAWKALVDDYEADLPEVKSVIKFDQLAAFFLERAKDEGWPPNWIQELRARLVTDRAQIKSAVQFVDDVESTVGKAVITNINGRELSTQEAG